jgi:hypothetical protein
MKNLLLPSPILILLILIFYWNWDTRERIFVASDELHQIFLYKNKEFELMYNGFDTAIGTYSLKGDTILLSYKIYQYFNPNKKLTTKVLIDTQLRRVRSLEEDRHFCADINLDLRNKR